MKRKTEQDTSHSYYLSINRDVIYFYIHLSRAIANVTAKRYYNASVVQDQNIFYAI